MKNLINRTCFFCALLILNLTLAKSADRNYVLVGEMDNTETFDRSIFSLNTKTLYNVDYKIELYNFFFASNDDHNDNLILITVLPDLQSGKGWEEIKDKKILDNLLDIKVLHDQLFRSRFTYIDSESVNSQKYFGQYIAVKKVGEK